MDVINELHKLADKKINWKKTTRENLDIDYGMFLPTQIASLLFRTLENDIIYESAEDSKIRIFGKWQKIPRQQAAYGDEGTSYHFSGKTVATKPWIPVLLSVILNISKQWKSLAEVVIEDNEQEQVSTSKYANGSDYIGEHRDNEPDLDPNAPIASLSLGQARDFILKHRDARVKGPARKNIPTVKLLLQSGSLLLLNPPSNAFWYHSLPPRKSATQVRVNLTFRSIRLKS